MPCLTPALFYLANSSKSFGVTLLKIFPPAFYPAV